MSTEDFNNKFCELWQILCKEEEEHLVTCLCNNEYEDAQLREIIGKLKAVRKFLRSPQRKFNKSQLERNEN